MNDIKCEKCGTLMISYKQGHNVGMSCPNCGWGWATTEFEPIELDQTIYIVNIDIITKPSIEEIKLVSKLLNVNYLIANKLLICGKASFQGKAIKIKDKLRELNNIKIGYTISPKFNYDI